MNFKWYMIGNAVGAASVWFGLTGGECGISSNEKTDQIASLSSGAGERERAMKIREYKEPLRLVVKGRKNTSPVAYACGTCGVILHDEELARRHCAVRLCDCGAVIAQKWHTTCGKCRARNSAERERYKRQQAGKVPWENWEGPVFCEGLGDEYFADVDALVEDLDYYSSDEIPSPLIVWACDEKRITLDARDILERISNDAWESINESSLQAVLNTWCSKQPLSMWEARSDLLVTMDGAPMPEKSEDDQ